MTPLLQSSYDPPYPPDSGPAYEPYFGSGIGLNVLCGIAGAIIIAKKGHGGGQILLHLLIGVFCCGVYSLVSALVAEDLALKERLEGIERSSRRIGRQRTHSTAGHVAPNQVSCPRCGTLNSADLVACWHCDYELPVEVETDEGPTFPRLAEVVDEPEPVFDSMRIACRKCGKRLQGRKGKIQLLKACPKCGATPFDYRLLPDKPND